MSIDRGDWHWEDAGSWEAACRHIGLFLLWAAERGLADDAHHPTAMRADPTKYFIGACDTKLIDDDLTEEGAAFARVAYTEYLSAYAKIAEGQGAPTYAAEDTAELRLELFDWLDDRLARWRPR